jgi:hypothetical protein
VFLVLIEGGNTVELEFLYCRARRRELRGGAHGAAVVRLAPEAADDPEDAARLGRWMTPCR